MIRTGLSLHRGDILAALCDGAGGLVLGQGICFSSWPTELLGSLLTTHHTMSETGISQAILPS